MAERPPDHPESLWERRPVLMALFFFGVIAVTGAILVITVGTRPHYRGQDWRLRTDVPPAGTGLPGPSYGEIPPAYRTDPVRIGVRVRAVDREGLPVRGVEAALITASGEVVGYGITEPKGTVTLRLPDRFTDELIQGRLRAAALVPGMPPISRTVPRPEDGVASLQLQVPRGVVAQLRVLDQDGRMLDTSARVLAGTAAGEHQGLAHGVRVHAGQAYVGALPLERPVLLELWALGRETRTRRVVLQDTGAARRLTLVAGRPWAHLITRLQGPEGADVAERRVRVRAQARRGGRTVKHVTRATTGRDGALEAEVPSGVDVKVRLAVESGAEARPRVHARLEQPVLRPGKRWVTGPLTLEAAGLVAAGRVVDEQGRPVPGTLVRLRPKDPGNSGPVPVLADEEGRFRLSGPALRTPFRVLAHSRDLDRVAVTRTFREPPAGDLSLRLVPAAGLEGTVFVPEALAGQVVVKLLDPGGLGIPGTRPRLGGHAGGVHFLFQGLPPGSYGVAVRVPFAEPWRLEDLVVEAGGILQETALQQVRPELPELATGLLSIRSPQGGPQPGARLLVAPRGRQTAHPLRLEADNLGDLQVALPPGAWVLARGPGGVTVQQVPELPATLLLQPPGRLAVTVKAPPPHPGRPLQVRLAPLDRDLPGDLAGEVAPPPVLVDGHGRAFFDQLLPGRWRVEAVPFPGTGPVLAATTVHLAGGEEPQRLTLEAPDPRER